MYVREVRMSYGLRKVDDEMLCSRPVQRPRDAAAILCPLLGSEVVEVCGLLCLSTKHDVLAYHELSRGTIDGTLVNPREVFRVALTVHAPAVIIGHNHPSGDLNPSDDDVALTRRLVNAGELIGVQLYDHLIVGMNSQYYSFREFGRI